MPNGTAVPNAFGAALPVGKFHYRDDLPLYLRRLRDPTPVNTLVKLFVLDRVLDAASVRQAIEPLDVTDLLRMGLIEQESEGGIRATVRLSGYAGLVLAHDRYDEQTGTLRDDHVLDVNPTTVMLANLTVRRRVRTALDIGTGCGVLALLAARHSDRVVATDTNPRALNLAAFNACLNDIDNVEWRQGSLFEPIEGSRFDLVVCNPPYVISPDSRFLFRDGGRRGDALSEEIVRRMPSYLEEGGFASILCNWGLREGETVDAPLRRWVEGSGCDAWLLWSATHDPLTYAAMWTRARDRATYDAALARWSAYFDELGVASIGLGGMVLRRRSAPRTGSTPSCRASSEAIAHQRIFTRSHAIADDRLLTSQSPRPPICHQVSHTKTAMLTQAAGVRLMARFSNSRMPTINSSAVRRPGGGWVSRQARQQVPPRAGCARAAIARLASLGFLPID
jgi:hypothetical protein